MQFFAERSLPNARAFLEAHSGEASRFASTIILPLCGVFKLDPASLVGLRRLDCVAFDTYSQTYDLAHLLTAYVLRPGRTADRLQSVVSTQPDLTCLLTTSVLTLADRGGSLFVNLRYYEAWHDAAVKAGVLEDALCSWYFSVGTLSLKLSAGTCALTPPLVLDLQLAHECAHNMVQSHNGQSR